MITTEEIKANRETWCQALESGEYKQGRHRLRTIENVGYSYCCLGVACELYQKATGKGAWVNGGFKLDADFNSHYIDSPKIAEYFGLIVDHVQDSPQAILSNSNDSGSEFPAIAAIIRALPLPEVETPLKSS